MQSETLRRADRALSEEGARAVLARTLYGTLTVQDDAGGLYSVPLSFAAAGDAIYFHGARAGRKWSVLSKPRRATFVAATDVKTAPAEFTTAFESVVLAGRIELVVDEAERERGFTAILEKYCAEVPPAARRKYFEEGGPHAALWRFSIETMTGKRHE